MRVSVRWLRQFVDTSLAPESLAEKLTMLGVEVEKVHSLDPGLDKVIVARIESVEPHPSADTLRRCRVGTGEAIVEVVCGAPNARPGLVAPLALVGAQLPNGMSVRAMNIRGVASNGMLCSEREIGLSDESEGLMELPPTFAPGTPLVEALGLDDVVLEISITANRPDCLSMVGVAREIAVLEGLSLRRPEPSVPAGTTPIEEVTSVEIRDPNLCPRYAARVIRGVTIGPSPVWLQQRLHAVGLRAINNVVDVTNFVLMELGHPLHAFDYDRLAGNRIVVRRARADETLETLDGESRQMTTETLVIADAEKPVALAGIMGGANSEVTDRTENILLESAYFNPISIRRTAKAVGLQTEASYRFERGADPEAVITAIDRAAELILEVAGGDLCAGVLDVYPQPIEPAHLRLRPARVNRVLGTEIPTDEMIRILTGLGCAVEQDDELSVIVPTFRPDLTREIDLVEEVARVYGYDAIPTTLPEGEVPPPRLDPALVLRRRIDGVMQACGLNEAVNYAWQSPTALDPLGIPEGDPLRDQIVIANPFGVEMSRLRTTLLASLLDNVRDNERHQVRDVRLYEIQRVFRPTTLDDLPTEEWMLGGVLSSTRVKHWSEPVKEVDFFDVKGILERLLEAVGIRAWSVERSTHPTFHPGRRADLFVEGERLGVFGEVHPDVIRRLDLTQRVYLFEISVDRLAEHVKTTRWMEALPPFPSTMRDLAIIVDGDVPAAAVEESIRASVSDLLGDVSLFDVYTGDPIPEGKKSLAYALEYRSFDRTLTDTEVDRLHAQIVHTLEERFGAELRGA